VNFDAFDLFLAASQANDLELALEDQNGRELARRELSQPFLILGRSPETDWVLDHEDVSRRHAYLQVHDGRVFWLDLHSRTGIRAGSKIEKSGCLDVGGAIGVGPFTVRVHRRQRPHSEYHERESRKQPDVRRLESRSPAAELTLQMSWRELDPPTWRVKRWLTLVGYARECHVRMPETDVSRFHCSLVRAGNEFWAVDLLGRGGISINDTRVRCGLLAPGDILSLGETTYRFLCHRRLRPLLSESDADAATPDFSVPVHGAVEHRMDPLLESGVAIRLGEQQGIADPVVPEKGYASPGLNGAAGSDVLGSSLLAMIRQFGDMQNQMFAHFRQLMEMAVQTFGVLKVEGDQTLNEELRHARNTLDRLNGAGLSELLHSDTTRNLAEPRAVSAEAAVSGVSPDAADTPLGERDPDARDSADAATPAASHAVNKGSPESSSRAAYAALRAMLQQQVAAMQAESQRQWQLILDLIDGQLHDAPLP
jgi:pSer/pThr/pTyr-binding forkhead associated (FHA) protein